MNRRISRKMEQSSVELSMSNGIINSQSNWSRCNSFSSSSSDSTLYCSNSSQHSSFSGRKRLRKDESIGKMVKRCRNSSGSSASSNVSCMSDKDINPPAQVSHEINSIETLDDMSPSTFQHEALLSSRLSHPLDMNAVLPFRHNLRRNIRRKACSCDCTATCTTVVVSRQYNEIGEQTVEEKTVISRTKVKTFVDSNNAQTPIRQVQMSKVSFQENVARENECSFQENMAHEKECSFQEDMAHGNECSFQENMAHKNECNRRRRPEIERLYESLHEIKWAKNFSPDNILRQLDVRQAASCSAFGKVSGEKPAKMNKSSTASGQIYTKLPSESPGKSNFKRCNKSYLTRSKIHSLLNFEDKLEEEDSNPPVLEKSIIITADETLDIDFPNYNTFPVLSKEVLTPEKDTNNIVDLSSTCNAIQTEVLNFDVNLHSDVDNHISEIVDCSSTFFDVADTIDPCVEEVGAEVIVSTSCDNDSKNLPLLTAVKEIHSSNAPLECPPVLEQCESSFSSVKDSSTTADTSNVKSDESFKDFFPPVNSHFICDEDYSLSSSLLEDCKRNYSDDNGNLEKILTLDDNFETLEVGVEKSNDIQSFCDIDKVDDDSEADLQLVPADETKNAISKPPVLEQCIPNNVCYVNIKSEICITENIKRKDIDENAKDSSGDRANLLIHRTKNFSTKSEKLCKSVKSSLKSESYIIFLGRRILRKYMKIINSKAKMRWKIPKMCNKQLKSSANSLKASPISSSVCNMENMLTHDGSLAINCAQMPLSVGSPIFSCSSPSRITETHSVNKKCISSSESTATVVNPNCATVIQSFNQKLSFSTSRENITLNQIKNSSKTDKKLCLNNNRQTKKPNNIFKNHYSENYADIPGYSKILLAAKKKEGRAEEKVKVPPRVFTCHFQTINVTRDNDYIQIVLKITRGKSIFLTHETLVELKEAINKAGNDKDCRLLILNGFGQTFCLGLDVRPLVEDHKKEVVGDIANAVKDLISTLADFQKPLFAIVNGAAYGLGLTILNHADVTLATSNASFCMPYSRLGYMPEGGATLTLPQAVGTTIAMDLILRGQVITAEQARDIGLVNEVVEVRHLPQDLVSRVKAIAQNSSPVSSFLILLLRNNIIIKLTVSANSSSISLLRKFQTRSIAL
nr:uncharacterized protein LOC107437468 isoform X1 [Parasteatoda tepidariorum]XP_042910069.1 uncharacterized protein LOC107437468 isoform X1 [Parasteatoda tepidariorum]XP_042910070.1 uncharacterized protein LOC107437468 isoform X1 [Parasteatoda tepidariorum]XP_042910071.1 uncharacterized protein LOC107437468 isoform X1 [Parasteatoda tepidariorum]XP_042910072.1 uncharacterized protein LOC107437468 isoform X1 [Parasteatoda tepidariorum]